MKYDHIIQQNIRVQAAPDVDIGDIKVCCVGAPITEECVTQNNECVCTVRQLLYIEFPVMFSIHTEKQQDVIDCDEPSLLPEPPPIRGQLKSARSGQPHRRPLLFTLMEMLQKTLFPRHS